MRNSRWKDAKNNMYEKDIIVCRICGRHPTLLTEEEKKERDRGVAMIMDCLKCFKLPDKERSALYKRTWGIK